MHAAVGLVLAVTLASFTIALRPLLLGVGHDAIAARLEPGSRKLMAMLKLHEVTDASGELSGIYLDFDAETESIVLVDTAGSRRLPLVALEKVLTRFGAPFDEQARVTRVQSLDLGEGKRLEHVRHLAGYDVVERDYVVLELGDGSEAHCAHGATVAAALQHLARAFA